MAVTKPVGVGDGRPRGRAVKLIIPILYGTAAVASSL